MTERPPRDAAESELVAACLQGEPGAWETFFARFEPVVRGAAERALRKLGAPDPKALAQDVSGDVFAQLVARDHAVLARFEGRSTLATWLRVLARRQAGKTLRKRRPGRLDEPTTVETDAPSPSDVAQVSERARIVREQVAALEPRDRLALQLFYEGGRSYREVGEALELPPAHVSSLLARARAKLAKALSKLG